MAFPIWAMMLFFLPLVKGCPEDLPPPCKCIPIGFHSSTVVCSGAESELELKKSLYFLKNTTIQTVQIINCTMNFLPSDLFKDLRLEILHLALSTFMSLSDTDYAFEGLENSLKILKVEECILMKGWEWYHLQKLTALTEINALKSGPLEIDEDIKDIAHLNITKLYLTRDFLSFIHDNAFSTFHNLRILSLKENSISEMKRSMLPNPANTLIQIILSYNELNTLPEDMFTNMPSLNSIILTGNHFLTLNQQMLAPVWDQLQKMDFTDNPLRCDCRLKWTLGLTFPKNARARCAEPATLKDKELQQLVATDLLC